jgi:hypothetical protein
MRLMLALLASIPFSIGWCIYEGQQRQIREQARLECFLADHGNVVKIIRMQDELKRELQGKSINTVRRVWFTCQFPDGYTIEIEQSHGGPTRQVPLVNDRWRLNIWNEEFYLYERLQ